MYKGVYLLDFAQNYTLTHFAVKNCNLKIVNNATIISILELPHIFTSFNFYRFEKILNDLNLSEYSNETFIHLSQNPLTFIANLLKQNKRIEFTYFVLDYNEGDINGKSGIQVFIYWIDDIKFPFFHLSNDLMFEALINYSNAARKQSSSFKLWKYDSHSSESQKLPPEIIAKLYDHPLFLYYLSGTNGIEAFEDLKQAQK